ncbi:MAG: Gfo/Idh/MocA family protein [Negativicutes bacterium]
MKNLGIAIIGSGMVAQVHAAALREIEIVGVRGIWGRNLSTANDLATKYGMTFYPTFESVLADPGIEAVIICLPPGYHAEFGVKAAAAGKHLLVEKPIETNLDKATQLIRAYRNKGLTLSVVFQNRFAPAAQKVKAALDAGLLGRLIQGDAYIKWYRSAEYYKSNAWRGTTAIEGGGALINQAIHTIDLLQWFMGPLKSIFGRVQTAVHAIETEDTGLAVLEWQNGALGVIEGSTALWPGVKEKIEIHGEKGFIALEGGNITAWKVQGCEEMDYVEPVKISYGQTNSPAISHVNHKAQLIDFISAIGENRDPQVTGEEGAKALAIVLAIYESSRRNQPFRMGS